MMLPLRTCKTIVAAFCCWLMLHGQSAFSQSSLEVNSVLSNNTFSNATFNTASFTASFATAPVVIPIPTQQGGDPCTARLRNVTATTFDIGCVEPPGNDGPHVSNDLNYIAIEPGVHKFELDTGAGVVIAAGCVTTDVVQHNCAGCGATGWVPINFGYNFSTPPSVLTHLRTSNSESGTPPGAPSEPFLTSVVEGGSITTTGFNTAIERSEVAQGSVREEELCWIAMEPLSCGTLKLSPTRKVNFSVQNTRENIDGWDNGCSGGEGVEFDGCFDQTPIVTASKITRNEIDGGWPRRCSLSASTARFTIDEDRSTDSERSHVAEQLSVFAFGAPFATTPVTLSYFRANPVSAQHSGSGVAGMQFNWTTLTESANAGFRLYAENFGRFEPVFDTIIPSHSIDSTTPLDYSLFVPGIDASRFRIADIDIGGHEQSHGPFEAGRDYGSTIRPPTIDWAHVRKDNTAADVPYAPAAANGDVELLVDVTGVHRVTYEQLVSAGFSTTGASIHDIALVKGDTGVRRRLISSDSTFGPGDKIEFLGVAVKDSLYTRQTVYRVTVDNALVARMPRIKGTLPGSGEPAWYIAKRQLEQNSRYAFSSPTDDPWYMSRLVSVGAAATIDYDIELSDFVSDAIMTPTVKANLWGLSRWPISPDHHYQIFLNNHLVADETFDGTSAHGSVLPVTTGQLTAGTNNIKIEVPGDTGATHDIVIVDSIEVRYPRAFMLQDGLLAFYAKSKVFVAHGLTDTRVVIYQARQNAFDEPIRVAGSKITTTGNGTSIRFQGDSAQKLRYFVAQVDSMLTPALRPAQPVATTPTGVIDFLIVSHSRFIDDLAPYVQIRQLQGLNVHVVDVADIYASESAGVVDPDAIRNYITRLRDHNQLRFVLLVGGDSYDYHDYLGLGSISFIPSPYTSTGDIVNYAPADSLLTDSNGDGFGELPIGRWPVRTRAELTRIIDKTLRYETGTNTKDGVFISGSGNDIFETMNGNIARAVPDDWTGTRIDASSSTVADARAATIAALNEGPRIASFIGHSGPSQWTFDGLFAASDVSALTNTQPFIINQSGCWNTYHVDPQYDTLGHAFLLDSDAGAVAVLGSATLTYATTEHAFARHIMERIATPGERLGDALQLARLQMWLDAPDAHDVVRGWNLLGDPTLIVNP